MQHIQNESPIRVKPIILRGRQQQHQRPQIVQSVSIGVNGGHIDSSNGMVSDDGAGGGGNSIVSMQPQLLYQMKGNPKMSAHSPMHQPQQHQHIAPVVVSAEATAAPSSSSSSPAHQATSRIPTMTQNFNQISKTATNLLNDIYEKHLLSQTTFENVNTLNGICAMNVAGNNGISNGGGSGNAFSSIVTARTTVAGGTPIKHGGRKMNGGATMVQQSQQQQRIVQCPPEQDLNFNNLCHQESASAAATAAASTKMLVNQRAIGHNHENLSTTSMDAVTNKATAYNSPQRAANACAIVDLAKAPLLGGHSKSPKARSVRRNAADGGDVASVNVAADYAAVTAAVVPHSMPPAKHHQTPTKTMPATDAKSNSNAHPMYAVCTDGNSYDANFVHPVAVGRRETNVFHDSSDYDARKQLNKTHGGGSHHAIHGYNGKISVRGEPVGGNFYDASYSVKGGAAMTAAAVVADCDRRTDTLAATAAKYERGSNNKINIMLETAQAMAAAAYFARLV